MSTILRKYGVQDTVEFPIRKASSQDFAGSGDWTPATGDVKISIDGGNFANTTNLPTAIGGAGSLGWTITLTAAEQTGKKINVQIADAATKAVDDQFIKIETFGHASAQYAVDLNDAVRMGLTALPNANADAAGGLPISDAGGLDMDNIVENALNAAIAELSQGIPSATPTLRTAVMALYMALRNKLDVETSGTPDVLQVHNDAGTCIFKKQLTDSGGDYSEAKAESGP